MRINLKRPRCKKTLKQKKRMQTLKIIKNPIA